MDNCEQCTHYVVDEEFGDYCDVGLDEDEMEKFLTQNMKGCHYYVTISNSTTSIK